jgi:hypothetical protein
LPVDKKREFEWLWAKIQLEGEHALTMEEKASLRALMEHIEQLVSTRLAPAEKNQLRRIAREHYKRIHPELAKLLEEFGDEYPIHHKRPLEYAHLFAAEDINATGNLAMVRQEVHVYINRAWSRFRQLCPEPTARQVRDASEIIDAQFAPWYDRAEESLGKSLSLDGAEEAAFRALDQLLPK